MSAQNPPLCVFLHGLLGDKTDWQPVIKILAEKAPRLACVALDLPWHGDAKQEKVRDFAEASAWLQQAIKRAGQNKKVFLVGYSLGGRLALDYALRYRPANLCGLILEGANFGLQSETERVARGQNDCNWAQRFANEPLADVLNDWYQQPVFAHLNAAQRAALIERRGQNNGQAISQMLQATSLAKQPDFRAQLADLNCPLVYICGEKDTKFQQIARSAEMRPILIRGAGHNAHQENPQEFAEQLYKIIAENIAFHAQNQ